MRSFSAVVFGLLLVSCGGGSSSGIPQADACNQASQSACAKLFSCTNDVVLTSAQTALGGTEAACRMMIQQNYCAPFMCSADQTYHPDKAQQCKNQFGTVTCATLSSAALAAVLGGGNVATSVTAVLASVPACTEVCVAGDAGASGG